MNMTLFNDVDKVIILHTSKAIQFIVLRTPPHSLDIEDHPNKHPRHDVLDIIACWLDKDKGITELILFTMAFSIQEFSRYIFY